MTYLNIFRLIVSHSLSRCSGFVCFDYHVCELSVSFSPCLPPRQDNECFPDVRLHKQFTFCPPATGCVSKCRFSVVWRTLMPPNVKVWFYLVPWLWWKCCVRGTVRPLCWFLSQRPLARAECVFACPEWSVKDRLSRTRCFRAILGVDDWSPWCSSWEDTMCVFLWKREWGLFLLMLKILGPGS